MFGMDISRHEENGTLTLSQSRYAQKVRDRFGMGSAREQSTSMDPHVDLTQSSFEIWEKWF